MSTRDQNIAGGRELDDLLQTLAPKLQKNIMRGALRAGAKVALAAVKERIPTDSGQLRASARITSRARNGEVTASVKVGNFVAWYAHLVEYGTKAHKIEVDERDRPINRKTGKRISVTTVNRHLAIGGRLIGPSVEHPGATARPFMRPAIDESFPQVVQAVTGKIRQRLTKQGLNVPEAISDPEA